MRVNHFRHVLGKMYCYMGYRGCLKNWLCCANLSLSADILHVHFAKRFQGKSCWMRDARWRPRYWPFIEKENAEQRFTATIFTCI